jgi:hypothetical protein
MSYTTTTKSDVVRSFTYSRKLMRDFIELTKSATEFHESSEIGQLVLELMANATIAQDYLDTQLAKRSK